MPEISNRKIPLNRGHGPSPPASEQMLNRSERWLQRRRRLSWIHRLTLSFTIARLYRIRSDFAARYIRGSGYEIGAQNSPLSCRHAKEIIYIDYLSRKESADTYNLPFEDCVEVDILADASEPDFLPEESASFLIANHVIEHCPNPIAALSGWVRILKPDGLLFLTLPNFRANEFDFEKQPASIEHMLGDYQRAGNNEDIVEEHIREHVRIIDGIDPADEQAFARRFHALITGNLHTHYHVFNRDNTLALLREVHRKHPIRVTNHLSLPYGFELIFMIRRDKTANSGNLVVRQDMLFNGFILLKHLALYAANRTTTKQ